MQINLGPRWLLLLLLIISACFLVNCRRGGGRGGGSRGGSRGRGSSTRYRPATSRPRPATSRPRLPPATYRPRPVPATSRPSPYRPSPAPAPRPKPSAPNEPVVVRQPAQNPNFKESSSNQGTSNNQPAYNPNFKPDGSPPGGPPPPYSPAGQPIPNAPVGPPPAYGSPGQRLPYSPGGQAPPYPAQPPPYPGNPGLPPSYPGLPARQPGQNPQYPSQPGYPAGQGQPYPVQPGYPGGNRPYPVQPGYPVGQPYPMQPGYSGGNRPYPVQPGTYPGARPYPVQPGTFGSNVWQPQSGIPAPSYMNSGGLPTGTNINVKPHKKKGFLGSLMSLGSGKTKMKQNKYYSPYSGSPSFGNVGGGMGHMKGLNSFLGNHKSAAMYAILPYMAAKAGSKLFRPRFGFMPFFMPMPHYHYGHGMYGNEYAHYYDVYNMDYVGKCQQPLKKNHSMVKCKSDLKEIECQSKCEEGYSFPDKIETKSNKCWHVTGVWRPSKNFPECQPVCNEECQNGGECIRPDVCGCKPEYRGDRCQFHYLNCDVLKLTKGQKTGWVCSHSRNETSCKIRCKPPGQFETPAAEEYKCTPEGKWTPDSLPRCIIKDEEKSETPAPSA